LPTTLAIDFPGSTHDEVHRIRNFGEDLHRALKNNGWAEISLDAVDVATDRLLVTVPHRKEVRRVEALIERMLSDQHLDKIGRLARLSEAG